MPNDGPSQGPPAHVWESVPLFPLPNVVFFPRAILPLHVFEERYKAMTADALRGPKRVAMALLKPGWVQSYHARPAIDPIVCVGQILSHERLVDGKYNFLLQGIRRARVLREFGDKPYRIADLEALPETPSSELHLCDQRRRMTEALHEDFAAFLPGASPFVTMLSGPMPTAAIADLIAFHLFDDVEFKQSLLADANVERRVTRIVDALHQLRPCTPMIVKGRAPQDPSCN